MKAKMKKTPRYQCSACGYGATQWAGRCPECGSWNTLAEINAGTNRASPVSRLSDLRTEPSQRYDTGLAEFNRVLGGGLVPQSAVLLGGDPGIGKSTLLLQTLSNLDAGNMPVLYASGEESVGQIAERAERLDLPTGNLKLLAENGLEKTMATVEKEKPRVLVIDSIQTLYSGQSTSAPGSVSQLRECAANCIRLTKSSDDMVLILVGHVTKEGMLAGPRLLEHMVDTVLYFEGDSGSSHRLLRAVKNRYGTVNEIGVFAMTDKGLREIKNPSAIFLSRSDHETAGSIVMVTREGNRPLLVEVQALVDNARSSTPRRLVLGPAGNRLDMLLAIMHRHGGISAGSMDVFVNLVGGVRLTEPASDLPALLAIVSSLMNQPLPRDLIAFGEIGLAGEIRPVPGGPERIKEAAKHGFKRALVPRGNAPRPAIKDMKVTTVSQLSEALKAVGCQQQYSRSD